MTDKEKAEQALYELGDAMEKIDLPDEIKMKAFALAVEKEVIFGSGKNPKEEG